MHSLLNKIKIFNSKHKRIAPVLIIFEIILIFMVSFFKSIFKNYKTVLAIVLVLIVALVSVRTFIRPGVNSGNADERISETADPSDGSMIVEEVVKIEDANAPSEASEKTSTVTATKESSSDKSIEGTSEDVKEADLSAGDNKDVVSNDGNIEYLDFIDSHQDAVGWIRFEDDLISYPIMQASDNSKYAFKDSEGNDSETGSIFLDYRSSSDFTDSNTIIYGHNMKDRTMFGALKAYKEDISFLDNDEHKYFQIITPEGTGRYLMFAFMDVPKDSYIYDVCGDDTSRMREFLDTIEYKTYIDTGIEPDVDDKIITLSTCTQKDDLYFVMFAVKVE